MNEVIIFAMFIFFLIGFFLGLILGRELGIDETEKTLKVIKYKDLSEGLRKLLDEE